MEKKNDLPIELKKKIYTLMVRSRVLEERMIKIYKAGEAFFWIGSPGEEAFGVCLGLLANQGKGLKHDYMHLHYRGTPTLMAYGMPMIDAIRLIMNRSTDINTGGRNFCNHYCYPEWNVVPVTSPIEVQYTIGIGTGLAQSRDKNNGITVMTGGDAGTAEGDFASCLIWSSRPERPLPMLITVQNNGWGISTSYSGQHGEEKISDRGKAFGMKTRTVNANDPIRAYTALKEAYDYVRTERKPYLLEVLVSRLYGHSSASGASLHEEEVDCVREFEKTLLKEKVFTATENELIWKNADVEAKAAWQQVRKEPLPSADSIWDNVYKADHAPNWRDF